MKKNLFLLVFLLLIAVVFTGCSKPVKQTGSLFLKFTIPQGATEYPVLPSNDRAIANDRDLSDDIKTRPIPTGTSTLHVAVYNKTTNWSTKVSVPVDPGETTATAQVTNIPVGSGYTVEVIPADPASTAIAIGRADGVVVQAGVSTSATVTVTKLGISLLSCPSTAEPLDSITVSCSIGSPVALSSTDLSSVHASFVDNISNPTIGGSFDFYYTEPLDLPASGWADLDFEGTVPDKEGTFYFLGVGMTYTQPVTNTEYSLFFPLNVPPAIVVEGDYTGSITIVIE